MDKKSLNASFETYFNAQPDFIVRAPGRVNIIGEHTDYNDGFVLPAAIDRSVWIALRPREDGLVRIHSLEMTPPPDSPQLDSAFDVHFLTKGRGWLEYPKGVADQLQKMGYALKGFDAVMSGDVPRGAGLSSSAAVELAVARAFAASSGFAWNPAQMALAAQKAENDWVGVNCGIMDQMASSASKSGHALFLDCRSLEYELVPLPKGIAIAILDTSTRRGLVDSAYNERRRQCEDAAHWFGVKALRDVSVEQLNGADVSALDSTVLKRARHVITENERVLAAVQAMKAGDAVTLGRLLNQSHASLRDDFEVTNDALNVIVECAQEEKTCFGARMTGAGFGGCAVALVKEENAQEFAANVFEKYRKNSGKDAEIYICKAGDGAGLID